MSYQVLIRQRDKPFHGVTANLHDKVPTPSGGGGGWEEVQLPHRAAVLIWRGRGLLKLTFSIIFDDQMKGDSVTANPTYQTLLHFWRPEPAPNHPPPEPPVLRLFASGDVIPYRNLDYVITNLEWGDATGDDDAQRTQQSLILEFTEFRADERLKTAAKAKPRTQRYKVRKGDTLSKIAREHGITAKALGAMQKPPIKDPRKLKVGQVIVVPVARVGRHVTKHR